MNDRDEMTESKEIAENVTHPEATSGVSSENAETVSEARVPASGKQQPLGTWRWFACATTLVSASLLCIRGAAVETPVNAVPSSPPHAIRGSEDGRTAASLSEIDDDSVLKSQIDEIKTELGQLRKSVEQLAEHLVAPTPTTSSSASAVETARNLEVAGNHEKAGYYWRNAVEHASDGEILSVLDEYAEAFFKSKTEDTEARYAEAATLERLTELALVRVPTEKMDTAFALRDKCAKFREDCFDQLAESIEEKAPTNDEPETTPEPLAKQVADEVEVILENLAGEIDAYAPTPNPEPGTAPSESECRILQLSGVAETAMSQLWFLDRSGVNSSVTNQINAFPKRLADLIDDFNRKHDAPIVAAINNDSNDNAPDSISHQSKFVFYTNRYETASNLFRDLRGTNDQEIARKSLERIMQKATNEKREQMNQYQLFVARCCGLAFEEMPNIFSEALKDDGTVSRLWAHNGFLYESADDYINFRVADYSKSVTSRDILNLLMVENLPWDIKLSLGKEIPKDVGKNRIQINNKKKAFIALAIFGFYRIDQSLLTPETSRIFNDVFQKYYEKLDDADKVKSVRWMVEMPKFKLEDF